MLRFLRLILNLHLDSKVGVGKGYVKVFKTTVKANFGEVAKTGARRNSKKDPVKFDKQDFLGYALYYL